MCGMVLGTALQLQQGALWSQLAYAAVALSALSGGWALARLRQRRWRKVALVALGMALAWGVTGWRAAAFQATALESQWEGRDVRIVGVIADLPQVSARSTRFTFFIESAHSAQVPPQTVKLPKSAALTWYGVQPLQGLHAGQRWAWTVRLKAPSGYRNPHGRDRQLWLWSQGIQATGYVRVAAKNLAPEYLAQTDQAWWAQWRGKVLQRMELFQKESAASFAAWGVVQALVTGAQSRIDAADWKLFRVTGVAHLVSISGLHITMFAWLAMSLVNTVWRRSNWLCCRCPAAVAGAWAGLLLAAVYAVFSGWAIPAQRTIGMLFLAVCLRSQARTWPWPYVWLLILTAVVLADPWSLLQAGFWLSFVAVGVLFAAQSQRSSAQGFKQACGHLLYQQCVVSVALAPLTVALFGQISVIGVLANLWAIPWVTLVVTPLSMLGILVPTLWSLAAYCVAGMGSVLQVMAAWPLAVVYVAQPAWWALGAGIAGGLWMVLPVGWRWRAMGLPLIFPMLLWKAPTPAFGHFELLAIDVGQGGAALVRTHQHSLLFDAGPRWSAQADAGSSIVVPVLRALGVDLSAMLISHDDGDHAGGARSVMDAFPAAQRRGSVGQPCQAGQAWQWDGVRFEVLHPSTVFIAQEIGGQANNAWSCVLRVQAQAGSAALLTGDIEEPQERTLLQSGQNLRAQLLLMPHHGSQTSSSKAFIDAVAPRFAIAQTGYRNRFGHPAVEVIQRYEQARADAIALHRCGAATWRSWQPNELRCERNLHPRYWSSGKD